MKWYWWALIVIVIVLIIWYFLIYKPSKNNPKGEIDPLVKRKFEDECETLFNTQQQVDSCVAEKLKALQ